MEFKNILILVGVAVYYYLRARSNSKKNEANQKNVKPSPKTSSSKGRSLEDILREFQQEVTPEPSPNPEQRFEEPIIEKEFVEKSKPIQPVKLVEIEEEEDGDEDSFDLRQAVINDAILNRPHRF